jgi:WD40 repeat protein
VRKVAWSADGAHLLSGGADGTVRLWRADGTPVCELQHPGIVHWVAFAADGQSILSAGSDGAVRIRPLPVGDLEAQAARVFRDYTAEERQRFAPLLR